MQAPILSYRYRPRPLGTTLSGLFFVVCAVMLFQTARTNTQGLVINHFWYVDPPEATVIYWLMTASSAALAGSSLAALIASYVKARYLTLSETELSCPKGLFGNKRLTIPLAEIDELYITKLGREKFLTIITRQKKYQIPSSLIPDNDAFETLYAHIAAAVSKLPA